jgi:uncharacterized protein
MRDLSDTEIARLQSLLDALPGTGAADAPLDVSALDGYLCGVLLQPQPVPEGAWWPYGAAAARASDGLAPLVRRRHAALEEAIAGRRWFDPWIFELEGEPQAGDGEPPEEAAAAAVRDSVLPWVAGFALAVERFPSLMRHDERALAEPLALLYQHFDADDLEGLEDEPALAAALADAEPPADLGEAAEDLVRAVLLLADVSRPVRPATPAPRRTGPARASPGPGPRSRSGRPARARRG